MCFACLAFALASMIAVLPNAADFNESQLTEFATILAPYLPDDARTAPRLAERLAEFARDEARRPGPGWRAFVPVLRPNEAELKRRAWATAAKVHEALRAGLITHVHDAAAREEDALRIVASLGRFYAALASYDGDPANRRLLRAFSLGGLPLLSFSLIASGVTIAAYPELCGAAPALLGGHLDHLLMGIGFGTLATYTFGALTRRGRALLLNLGTKPYDIAAGASRAEKTLWSELARRWAGDANLRQPPAENPTQRLNALGGPLRAACARWLTVDPAPPGRATN